MSMSSLGPMSLTCSLNIRKTLGTVGRAKADLGFAKTSSYDEHSEDMAGRGEGGACALASGVSPR